MWTGLHAFPRATLRCMKLHDLLRLLTGCERERLGSCIAGLRCLPDSERHSLGPSGKATWVYTFVRNSPAVDLADRSLREAGIPRGELVVVSVEGLLFRLSNIKCVAFALHE